MQSSTLVFIAFAFLAIGQINSQPIWEDENGNSYFLVPVNGHSRHARSPHHHADHHERETTYDFGNRHAGLGQKYTFENDNHKFTGEVYGSRDFAPKGPLTTGQSVDYLHKSTNSAFSATAENTRGAGTDFKASGVYNFYQTPDKRGTVGIGGEYERHYGGPGGASDPKYNVLLKGTYNLP